MKGYESTARRAYEQVNAFDDVQEDFILPVADALRPPRHSIGNRHRWANLSF